jgi:hypothetical protein
MFRVNKALTAVGVAKVTSWHARPCDRGKLVLVTLDGLGVPYSPDREVALLSAVDWKLWTNTDNQELPQVSGVHCNACCLS